MQRRLLITGFAVACLSVACGDDGGDTKTTGTDGGSQSRSDASSQSGDDNVCMPTGNVDVGSCTQAEVAAYSACTQAACKDQYETCFGSDYAKGKFGGPCKDFLTCTSKCDCTDSKCTGACTPSTECSTCTQGAATCGQSCLSKLTCAFAGLADSGISFNKTCKDLKACCDSLSGAQASTCSQYYGVVSAQGDLVCSAAISQFCPN